MASKKKGKGKGKKGNKVNEEIEQLRKLLDTLKKSVDEMTKTIKKQNKRIGSLETENKRINKKITKLMLQGSSGSAIAPQQSDTSMDADDDDKKEEKTLKIPSKKSTKDRKSRLRDDMKRSKSAEPPQSTPLKPKPKKVKFTFDLNHQKIKIGDNGAAAAKPKTYGGTIRFGRYKHFTKNNNENIESFIVKFDTRSTGQHASTAFGFATKSFNQWSGSNFGENGCCMIKGNGQHLTTPKVFKNGENKEYQHKKTVQSLLTENAFFKPGQDMALELDLKNLYGKIWNDTLNKDGEDKEKIWEMKLPNDYELCMVAYLGGSAKKRLIVKEQIFKFVGDDDDE